MPKTSSGKYSILKVLRFVSGINSKKTRAPAHRLAEGANEALNKINIDVDEINGLNQVIASASQEQAHVAREIDRNLVNIRDLAIPSSEGAAQTSKSGLELSLLAEKLSGVVGRFKLLRTDQ